MAHPMTYEEAQAKMPEGWSLWGNHGDGKWRAGIGGQDNRIIPSSTLEEALTRATEAAEGAFPLSINPSTANYQLAAQQATEEGHRPGSGQWWQAIRRIKAEWIGLAAA